MFATKVCYFFTMYKYIIIKCTKRGFLCICVDEDKFDNIFCISWDALLCRL